MDSFAGDISEVCIKYAPASIAILDMDLRYIAVSDRWINDYGLHNVELIGRTHYEIFPDIPQRWKDIHQRCLTGEVMSCEEDPFPREDGGIEWVKWQIRPWHNNQNEMSGIIMFTEVITAQKNLEFLNKDLEKRVQIRTREMEKLKNQAEQVSQAKTQFLSRMSHELRTPLNAIIGFSQLLGMDSDNLNDEQKQALENIDVSGQHLLRLVVEVLDLSTIESGDMQVSIKSVPLNNLIKEVSDLFENKAKEAGIHYVVDSLGDLPEVMVDADRLKEILSNLLSNGIKFNKDKGSLTMQIKDDNSGFVRIDVIDTGCGIKSSDQSYIFEPFNRVIAKGEEIPGSGVGLALVKRYASLMNCEVGVDSKEGVGSRFWLTVPVASNLGAVNYS
ncbi:MAG: ATP-binding protein [Gammaproteobacteria bacterium]|nr:ATP-binding protein [Gammaproteobacteria bacterium]